MSEMSEEDLMRRVYYKETFDGSPHSLNSATTEAKDNSSSELNVKDENNLSEKPQSLKSEVTPKNNSENVGALYSTKLKLAPPNPTLENKTINENKNIEQKKKSSNSEFTYERPGSLLDDEYQNLSRDKSNNPFDSHYDYNDDSIYNFRTLNDNNPNEENFYEYNNNFNILEQNKQEISDDDLLILSGQRSITPQGNIDSANFNQSTSRNHNFRNSQINNFDKSDLNLLLNSPKAFDCYILRFKSGQSPSDIFNKNVKIFNPFEQEQNIIPNIKKENNKINNHNMMLDEEEEEEKLIIKQIFDISRNNNFLETLEQREFGKQMRHAQILQSESKSHLNNFLKNHSDLAKYALYFEKNELSFLDKRIINLKKRIFDYGPKLVNLVLVNNNYKLVCIDYLEATKIITASFNLELLDFELSYIFSNYQDRNHSPLNHNREIINYIKDNRDSERNAYYLVSLKLKDFIRKVFNKDKNNGLKLYLNEVKELLYKIEFTENNEKIRENLRNEKIKALNTIDKTLSEDIQEYFESKNKRKKKEKNMDKNNKNKKKKTEL